MKTPQLLARQEEDEFVNNDFADVRARIVQASTTPDAAISEEFHGGAEGTLTVERFDSVHDEDRGGVVLRLRIESLGQAFVPYAVNVEGGVEIHVAGATEAKKMMSALRALLLN